MNREDARVLAKRMFQQLSRLAPRSRLYHERAAVLVDVLVYAGFEHLAEGLALAVAGRYPRDRPYYPLGLRSILPYSPSNTEGMPVAAGDEWRILQYEVYAVRQRMDFSGIEAKSAEALRKRLAKRWFTGVILDPVGLGLTSEAERAFAWVEKMATSLRTRSLTPYDRAWAFYDVQRERWTITHDVRDLFSMIDMIRGAAERIETPAVWGSSAT